MTAGDGKSDYGCDLTLFTDVENSDDLHSRLMSGENLGCVLIQPALIMDPLQVALAVYKAKNCAKMTTRSLYTEVLYNLGPTKNIGSSLKTFGLSGQEKEVLAVIVEDEFRGDKEKVLSQIKGQRHGDLSHLPQLTDLTKIIKQYKLNSLKPEQHSQIRDVVLSRIAAKEVI